MTSDQYKYNIRIQKILSPETGTFKALATVDIRKHVNGNWVTEQQNFSEITASSHDEAERKMKIIVEKWVHSQAKNTS